MKTLLSIFSLILITSCNSNKSTNTKESLAFYVGTYTSKNSKGIYKYALNTDGVFTKIGLVAKTENPSFLSFSSDKKHLIAANEIDLEGSESITCFSIKNDSLILKNSIPSGGTNPCFVTTNSDNYVLATNYSSGTVALASLQNDGLLTKVLDIQQHDGNGTTSRQEAPHAHSAWFEPNSNTIISVDLGTNQLWFSKIDSNTKALNPVAPFKLDMAKGAGPRHLTFHPNNKWIYVLNELNNTVSRIEKSPDTTYHVKESISTLPENFSGNNTSADIHVSLDGKFLYTSNRGHNSIAIFKIDSTKGSLNPIGHESTKGLDPRNFSLTPNNNYIVVANQNSNNLVAFKRNKNEGTLMFTDEINAPTPVCVLFE
ncbi:lactonase family protein [Formosa haliotis]|uniref:lactonase family protein n=1 Tax=Formosa haliotis TaxID=1555194 RepID=UPI0008246B3F|nr:lactonase family protein [Formosa haliotis]